MAGGGRHIARHLDAAGAGALDRAAATTANNDIARAAKMRASVRRNSLMRGIPGREVRRRILKAVLEAGRPMNSPGSSVGSLYRMPVFYAVLSATL